MEDKNKTAQPKKLSYEELQKTIHTASLILKGLVARDLWDMSEYFQVIYEEDPVVLQALELLHKEQQE